jgi:4-carboxymuconolactone decarboxylase
MRRAMVPHVSNTKTRLAPLDSADWDEQTRKLLGVTVERVALLEGGAPEDGESSGPLNILRTLAHHPRLLEPFLAFAATLAMAGALPRRESELIALRAAMNCRSAFEWGHHAQYALAAGLSEQEVGRVAQGPDAAGWSDRDRLLLQAADELHEGQDVSDATWRRLENEFSPAQLVEIPFVVGNYTMLSMVANSTGVALEPGLPALPD